MSIYFLQTRSTNEKFAHIWIYKLTKNGDLDKYKYSGCSLRFDSLSKFY